MIVYSVQAKKDASKQSHNLTHKP